MAENINKQDVRIAKTRQAILDAMSKLLESRNFKQITVKNLCEEALVSRAAFYVHFEDKYDLLQHWLTAFGAEATCKDNTYEQMEKSVNNFVQSNKTVIKNLMDEASDEVLIILHAYILSLLELSPEKNEEGIISPKHIVLSSFCTGGVVNYLLWQVKNKFPSDIQPMNIYLFEIIETLRKLD